MRKFTKLEFILIAGIIGLLCLSVILFQAVNTYIDLWLNGVQIDKLHLQQLIKDHPDVKAYQIMLDLDNKILEINK